MTRSLSFWNIRFEYLICSFLCHTKLSSGIRNCAFDSRASLDTWFDALSKTKWHENVKYAWFIVYEGIALRFERMHLLYLWYTNLSCIYLLLILFCRHYVSIPSKFPNHRAESSRKIRDWNLFWLFDRTFLPGQSIEIVKIVSCSLNGRQPTGSIISDDDDVHTRRLFLRFSARRFIFQ